MLPCVLACRFEKVPKPEKLCVRRCLYIVSPCKVCNNVCTINYRSKNGENKPMYSGVIEVYMLMLDIHISIA